MTSVQDQILEVQAQIADNELDMVRLFDILNKEVAENGIGSMETLSALQHATCLNDDLMAKLTRLIRAGAKEIQQLIEKKRARGE